MRPAGQKGCFCKVSRCEWEECISNRWFATGWVLQLNNERCWYVHQRSPSRYHCLRGYFFRVRPLVLTRTHIHFSPVFFLSLSLSLSLSFSVADRDLATPEGYVCIYIYIYISIYLSISFSRNMQKSSPNTPPSLVFLICSKGETPCVFLLRFFSGDCPPPPPFFQSSILPSRIPNHFFPRDFSMTDPKLRAHCAECATKSLVKQLPRKDIHRRLLGS